ncbi:hypothetical protein MUK42_32540 [Musa troglodytarum]|uniref:Uncharacterized protein n=1 Tax=Musa troglodytarum TaxID=320322 RepID=A0A9E7KQU3_9LILI|nr:hypothetical protein MUK42_32540 [Musa troglodytarum]
MSISSHVFRLRHANTSPFRSHPIFFFELRTKQIMTPMFFPDHAMISIYYNNAELYCSKDRRRELPLLHDCGWIRRGRSRREEGENEAERDHINMNHFQDNPCVHRSQSLKFPGRHACFVKWQCKT